MTPFSPPLPVRASLRRFGLLTVAGFLALAGGALAQTPAPDGVVAKVDNVEIRESDLALAEEDVGQNLPQASQGAKRDYLVNYLSDMILLAKAAEASNIQDNADFKKRAEFSRRKALMEVLLAREGKAAITDEALRKVYADAVTQMGNEEEVHARHILIRVAKADDAAESKAAEDKIKGVIERLKKGEDFVALAKDITEDPSGKQDGGDLGYFTKGQMVPEFSEVAFKLDKGKISDPIKTQFGWHVLKVEDKRKKQPPEFDKVKDQLETYVTRKAQVELVTKLRGVAKIERMDQPADKPAEKPAEPKK